LEENPCPYHHGTEREYECSKEITAKQVILTIERLLEDKNSTKE